MMSKYSFIIPTFGREQYLLYAINSIDRITNIDSEIIVVDDDPNSNIFDNLTDDIKNKITYIKHSKNRGPGYSRKEGFLQSTGDYIIFMDDDDFYTNTNFLAYSEKQFHQYPNIAFVAFNANSYYMDSQRIVQEGMLNRNGLITRNEYLKEFQIRINKPKSTFTTIFSKAKLIRAGINNMEMVNDTSIFLRASLVGDAYLCSDIIGNYRIHATNITKTLSAKFIVDNLVEKENIFKLLTFNTYIKNKWLYRQSRISIIYFYTNNKKYKEDTKIIEWVCKQNLIIRILLLKDIFINISKRHIKKIIRG